MTNALTPALLAIRQKEFYSEPRFHASIAWALLDHPSSTVKRDSPVPGTTSPEPHPEQLSEKAAFPTISHFPKELIQTLNTCHGAQLASQKIGTFEVEEITVKIGKEVYTWALSALQTDGANRE